MDILVKLFGSLDKVKIMRLFLFNPGIILSSAGVAKRIKSSPLTVRREIMLLSSIDFIRQKKVSSTPAVEGEIKRDPDARGKGWQLNPNFPYLSHLRVFLKADLAGRKKEIADRFNNCGKIKFLLISGVFINDEESRADIVVVGDELKKGAIERIIGSLEAEFGRELNYAVFNTTDFAYRVKAYDKFVRDILDYPHELVIDKIGVS